MIFLFFILQFTVSSSQDEAVAADDGAAAGDSGAGVQAVSGYVGPDSYREGYSGGDLQNNLVLWKLPEGGIQHYEEPYPYIVEQVTILESSRYKYPTKQDPEQSTAVNLAHFIIDSDLKTKWWSAIDELQSWIEIDLGNPAHRIRDEDSQNFFLWKFEDQIDAGKEIEYLDGGLIGFHIDQVIIRWSEMFASADYKIQSSIDKIQWKDRAVQLEMPNVYDRVDIIPGWSVQGVGNTRYLRITMVERVYAKNAWGMREGVAWKKVQEEEAAAARAAAAAAEAEASGENAGGRRRRVWSSLSALWNNGLRVHAVPVNGDIEVAEPHVYYGGYDPRKSNKERKLSYSNMPSDEGFITPEEQYNIGRDRDGTTETERTVYGIREIEVIGPEPSSSTTFHVSFSVLLILLMAVLVVGYAYM
jgi:hypothetical protein